MWLSLNISIRKWFSLNTTRPCGYFQGCKRAAPSSIMRVNSPEASWKCLRTPLRGFLEVRFLKKSRSRGAVSEGYARPRAPSPNRLFSVPCANSGLIFVLFFHFSDEKTRSRPFFAPRISKKKSKTLGIVSKNKGWGYARVIILILGKVRG